MSKEAEIVTAKILQINEIINYGERVKHVFYCESKKGTPQMCIYWAGAKLNLNSGDIVQVKGRHNHNAFLCWKLLILKRG